MKSFVSAAQLPDFHSLMRSAVVPDYDHLSSQVSEQVAEKIADLELGDVAFMEAVIKAEAISDGTHRYA